MKNRIHILLPPREVYTDAASGAVALVVNDFYKAGRYKAETHIYGKSQQSPLPGNSYISISPSWRRVLGITYDYGVQAAHQIPDAPSTYIEIHNRAKVLPIIKKLHKKSKVALYLHNNPLIMGGLKTAQERQHIFEMADAVICVSDFVKNRFLEGIESSPSDKIHVIPNAITINPAPVAISPSINRILFVGRMTPKKGVYQLAQALAEVLPHHSDWQAAFIGASRPGEDKTSLFEEKIRQLLAPLGDRVTFLGQIPNNEVHAQMHNASIVVIPSICIEAFPRVAAEAIANGCAVISSGRGGLPQACGPASLTINPENSSDISSALESFINNPTALLSARKAGREHAIENFDMRIVASRLDDLRASILEGD